MRFRRCRMRSALAMMLGGWVLCAPQVVAVSSEDSHHDEAMQAEVTKRVDEAIREAGRDDPELAAEMKRQAHLVMREIRHGHLGDDRTIQSIEMYQEVQREISARVAQAADGPAHFGQVYKDALAHDPHEAEQLKAAFDQVSRGEIVHPSTPDMMDRLLAETKQFSAENPEFAAHARAFLHHELERYQRELDAHSPHSAAMLHQAHEAAGYVHQEPGISHGVQYVPTLFTAVGGPKAESHHSALTPESESSRETLHHEVERVRELPTREIERIREAPTREIERVREVPAHEVERVRETPTAERSAERTADQAHDRNDKHLDRQQKTPHRR